MSVLVPTRPGTGNGSFGLGEAKENLRYLGPWKQVDCKGKGILSNLLHGFWKVGENN